MEEILSIFKNDAFTAATLDKVAPNIPYVPSFLGSLGIFQPRPVRTRNIELMVKNGVIQLVPTSEIGAPDPLPTRGASEIRSIRTYRLSQRDRLMASEIQGIISMPLGSPQQLRGMAEEIAERSSQLRQNNEYTLENHRLGALQGKVMDADGTTVVRNFWTEFGVTEPAEIFFDFATIAAGALQQFIEDNVVRPMRRALQGRLTPGTRIYALVGDSFWSKLIGHADMRQVVALRAQSDAAFARLLMAGRLGSDNNGEFGTTAWGQIDYGGVTWVNYMGTVNGEIAIGTDKARFFPVGATDVFKVYWAPGERIRDVNQLGQPAYLILQPDPRDQMNEYVDIYFRNYPLFACIFPQAILKGRSA